MESIPLSNDGKLRVEWWTEEVDAVIVATGDNEAAWIPDIPGLEAVHELFSDRIFHSRDYRTPDPFKGKVSLFIILLLLLEQSSCSTCTLCRCLNYYLARMS